MNFFASSFLKNILIHILCCCSLDPDQIKSSRISQMSKDSSCGNQRPQTQNAQSSRKTRAKFEEPQCVTLSSDEDDDFSGNEKTEI